MRVGPEAREDAERRALSAIDGAREELAAFVSEAVRIRSVNGQEGVAEPLFSGWFERNGFEAVVAAVSRQLRDRHPLLANESNLEDRPNVFGWWRTEEPLGEPLVLNGHIDVVPAGDEAAWQHPPFGGIQEGGRIHGRGAVDMKGPLIAGMYAVRALRDAGVLLPFDVQVQCVMGEESGGLGTISAIETEPRPGAAVVLESTEGVVCPASGGILQFTICVEGRSVHTSVPWHGVSALDKLIVIYESLRELARRRDEQLAHPLFEALPMKAPFAVGTFNAGEWRAAVPERARMEGRIGILPGEALADVRALVEQTVASVSERDEWLREHPARVVWISEGAPAWETAVDSPIVRALVEGARAVADETPIGAATYGSDAGHFAAAGIPTVLFGPGRIADAHRRDESIAVSDLVRAAKIVAAGISRYGQLVEEGRSGTRNDAGP